MPIDLNFLRRALHTLYEALVLANQDPGNTIIRDATIQRFEYCYELTHKTLRKYLSATEPSASEIEKLSFADLIRLGSARGLLLSDWQQWQIYRTARNMTSHTYDEEEAMKVMDVIPQFYQEALYLINQFI